MIEKRFLKYYCKNYYYYYFDYYYFDFEFDRVHLKLPQTSLAEHFRFSLPLVHFRVLFPPETAFQCYLKIPENIQPT